MIHRTVLEWERLQYGDADDQIPLAAAVRLAAVAKASPLGGRDGNRILALGLRDLKAGQVVGVVAAPGCSLEILPKIDGLGENGIRNELVHMLSVCFGLALSANHSAGFSVQSESLLDIFVRLFAERALDAVRQGMPRKYVNENDDLRVLRGRLDVRRQFTVHAASPQKLACSYGALSTQIALNQIIKATVSHLIPYARNERTKRLLAELRFVYWEIAEVPVGDLRWDEVLIDRTNSKWQNLIHLARLLLQCRYQTTSFGTNAGFALLFEMNSLFELYVSRMLSLGLGPDRYDVSLQGGLLYCVEDLETGAHRFQTKPDIIVRRHGHVVTIIDAKWKGTVPAGDDPRFGISQADIYQMMAYAHLYTSPEVILLYPHHGGLGRGEGVFARNRIHGTQSLITAATVDLANRTDIARRLRDIAMAQQ